MLPLTPVRQTCVFLPVPRDTNEDIMHLAVARNELKMHPIYRRRGQTELRIPLVTIFPATLTNYLHSAVLSYCSNSKFPSSSLHTPLLPPATYRRACFSHDRNSQSKFHSTACIIAIILFSRIRLVAAHPRTKLVSRHRLQIQ